MATTTKDITTATRDVVTTVLEDGGLDSVGTILSGIWECDKETLKESIKGSLLLLNSGEYAVVPGRTALVARGDGHVLRVREGSGAAHEKDGAWLDASVKGAWLGVLIVDDQPGAASKLAYNPR